MRPSGGMACCNPVSTGARRSNMAKKSGGKGPAAVGKPTKETAATKSARQGKPSKGGKKK